MSRSHWLLTLGAIVAFGATTTVTAQASSYYTTNPGIIRTKHAVTEYSNATKTKAGKTLKANSYAKITDVIETDGHAPILKTSTDKYITANKAFVTKTTGYQNPKAY